MRRKSQSFRNIRRRKDFKRWYVRPGKRVVRTRKGIFGGGGFF